MSIKLKLTLLNFFQLFVWGAWLITIGVYWFQNKGWGGAEFGAVFSTLGLASLIMPALTGIIADRWMNLEKLYGILHILYGITLFYLSTVTNPQQFFWVMLAAMFFYMPTISLCNSLSYTLLKRHDFDVVKDFPPIRVWGTIGFIAAMWITNLSGNKALEGQFYIGGAFAILWVCIHLLYQNALRLVKRRKIQVWLNNLDLMHSNYLQITKWHCFSFSQCFWVPHCN